MRQTVVVTSCDACKAWKHAETVEGVETVPTAGGSTLDLCPEHRDGMRAVLALIAEWGSHPNGRTRARKAESSTPNGHPVPAPASSSAVPVVGKRTRRGGRKERERKASTSKGTGAAVVVDVLACPLCGRESPTVAAAGMHLRDVHGLTSGAVYGDTCPLCGHVGTARGLGVHGRNAHDAGGVAVLFSRARAAGDPKGVIAARSEAVAALVSRTPVDA